MVRGGSNFSTHRLSQSNTGLVLRKTWRTWWWGFLGLAIGAVFLAPGVWLQLDGLSFSGLCSAALGLFFVAGGLLFITPRAIRFEADQRVVIVAGRRVPFADVAGLQVLGERIVEENAPDYDSYELNLVLRDGTRLNLVDHSKRRQLEQEALQLAHLMDCRVLDEKVDGVAVTRQAGEA